MTGSADAVTSVQMVAAEAFDLLDTGRQVAPFSSRLPRFDLDDAYRVTAAVRQMRETHGEIPLGRKIGFTNRTIWPRYGVCEPIWGTVYDRTLMRATGERALVPLEGLVNPRIEPEICFALKSAPRGSSVEALLEAIDWVAHSIEIVQSRFAGWKFKLADCTAANGLHGRLVVGPPVPLRELPQLVSALPSLQVELLKEAAVVDHGVGANVLDSPLLALGHLVEVLAKQPGAASLAPGEIISTGTITDAHPVLPGETWSTQLRGLPLPGLTVRFT
jgi:2-oxo-3-hexenedioate decarboxylase